MAQDHAPTPRRRTSAWSTDTEVTRNKRTRRNLASRPGGLEAREGVKMRAKARQNIHMKACESARERTRGSPGGAHKYASVTCPRGMSTWHSSSDHVDAYVAQTRLGPRGRCAHMRRMNRLFWPHKLVHVACPRGQPIWPRGQPT